MLIDYLIQDPYNKYMDFAPALFHIPFMDTIITDTHFGLSILCLLLCFHTFRLLTLMSSNYVIFSDTRSYGSYARVRGTYVGG
jgi:hypothetical protein